MPNIKGPDGKVISFPEGTSDADIAAAFAPAPVAHPVMDAISDFGKGVLKGGIHTMSAADDFAAKHLPAFMTTPIGQTPNAENSARAVQAAKDMATPHNTAQSLGRGVEQAAEFLGPAGAEKALLGGGGAVAKAGLAALGSGIVNKVQGGSFAGGAAAGGIGSGIATGLSKIAAPIAEKAMGIRGVDRAFGRTPGQAILDETTGVRPGTIAGQAEGRIGELSNQLESDASASSNPVYLPPVRQIARDAYGTAVARNEESTIKEMNALNRQLGSRAGTQVSSPISPAQTTGWGGLGQKPTAMIPPTRVAIPPSVSAPEALALKRGVGDLATSWNPATTGEFTNGVIKNVYGELDRAIDAAVPSSAGLNSRISTLIPVAKRAGATDLNENLIARTVGRFGKPTGALLGAAAGASEGRREGGTPGAIAGGIAGLVAPEVLASPTTMMVGARMMNSPALGRYVIPAANGLGLNLLRKKEDEQ